MTTAINPDAIRRVLTEMSTRDITWPNAAEGGARTVTVEFANNTEVTDFAAACVNLGAAFPGSHGDHVYRVLGEVAAEIASVPPPRLIVSPEGWKFLIQQPVDALLTCVDDHGPVKVMQVSRYYRRRLSTIAALALTAMMEWDSQNAPGEAGEVLALADQRAKDCPHKGLPCPDLASDGAEACNHCMALHATQTVAACAEGLRPIPKDMVVYGDVVTERYRPDNLPEYRTFMDDWCGRCSKDSEDAPCQIALAAQPPEPPTLTTALPEPRRKVAEPVLSGEPTTIKDVLAWLNSVDITAEDKGSHFLVDGERIATRGSLVAVANLHRSQRNKPAIRLA